SVGQDPQCDEERLASHPWIASTRRSRDAGRCGSWAARDPRSTGEQAAMTTELESLKARIEQLEAAAKPKEPSKSNWPGPREYTDGMSMPASAILDLAKAVPDSLCRALAADARKPNPVTGGAAPQSQQVERGSGWRDPVPLGPPEGIE